jgi:hypothetical protein
LVNDEFVVSVEVLASPEFSGIAGFAVAGLVRYQRR